MSAKRPLLLSLVCLALSTLPSARGEPQAPAGAPVTADAPAVVRQWTAPEASKEALQGGETVSVRFIVDATGVVTSARVLQSPSPALNDLAIAAIKSWTFSPAIERGHPAASCLDVDLVFSAAGKRRRHPQDPPNLPRVAPRVDAVALKTPNGKMPDGFIRRKLQGRVGFVAAVDTTGHLVRPTILFATHVEFVSAALEALKEWEFTPGMQGDLPIPSKIQGTVICGDEQKDARAVLMANGVTGTDGQAPAIAPFPVLLSDPVVPYDLLMKGASGSAIAEFVVKTDGRVGEIRLRSATDPRFADALRSALERWVFTPAEKAGQPVEASLSKRVVFTRPDSQGGRGPQAALARIISAEKEGTLGTSTGLDAPLTPIYRVSPAYPAALKTSGGTAGQAEVVAVICRDGRVRLARAVSATDPEFGLAAVSAISDWVFMPPLRAGKPVDVKIRIPVKFAAPSPS